MTPLEMDLNPNRNFLLLMEVPDKAETSGMLAGRQIGSLAAACYPHGNASRLSNDGTEEEASPQTNHGENVAPLSSKLKARYHPCPHS